MGSAIGFPEKIAWNVNIGSRASIFFSVSFFISHSLFITLGIYRDEV
jgi:hypothetical protein